MAEIDTTQDKRCRGRPQLRPDDETRRIIYEAARHEFAGNGFAATSIETVARRAGVSTKTLYRLIPNKAALFEGMVSDRMDRFVFEVKSIWETQAETRPGVAWGYDFVEALRGGVVNGRLTGSAIHLATRYDVFRKWLVRRRTKKGA